MGPLQFKGTIAPFEEEEAAREEEEDVEDEEEDGNEHDEEDGDKEDEQEDAAEDADDPVEVDTAGVRKKKASGSRCPKWKVLEDQCLCESWATVGHDSVISANQKHGK
jgi:hypothetical protein